MHNLVSTKKNTHTLTQTHLFIHQKNYEIPVIFVHGLLLKLALRPCREAYLDARVLLNFIMY